MPEPLLRHKQVAALLGVTPNALTIAYCRRKPHLPPRYLFGRTWRYIEAEVIAALKANHLPSN